LMCNEQIQHLRGICGRILQPTEILAEDCQKWKLNANIQKKQITSASKNGPHDINWLSSKRIKQKL